MSIDHNQNKSISKSFNGPDVSDCTYIALENLNELRNDIIEVKKLLNGNRWLRDQLKNIHSSFFTCYFLPVNCL